MLCGLDLSVFLGVFACVFPFSSTLLLSVAASKNGHLTCSAALVLLCTDAIITHAVQGDGSGRMIGGVVWRRWHFSRQSTRSRGNDRPRVVFCCSCALPLLLLLLLLQ